MTKLTGKLSPYAKVITLAKEKVQEALAPIRAREMRKKAELEMAKIEGDILTKQQKVQELAAAYPIDFAKLIDALDEIALLERKLEQLSAIIMEMFPE